MSTLPKFAGQLNIDFMDDFHLEKVWHNTDNYLEELYEARNHVDRHSVCCYCGFFDEYFLELHHINGDHDDFSDDNLRHICTLCHRMLHLGWVGIANLGKIIYLPSLVGNNKRFWLEPLSHIQRFYLMTSFLQSEEQARLAHMPLTQNITDLMQRLESQDISTKYFDAKAARASYMQDLERLQSVDPKNKKVELEAIKNRRIEEQAKLDNAETGNDFANLHVLDLLSAIVSSGKKKQFLANQAKGLNGRMAIWFNPSVFEPFEPTPSYTLSDRLSHYQDMGLFSASGLQEVMHNLRSQYMEND